MRIHLIVLFLFVQSKILISFKGIHSVWTHRHPLRFHKGLGEENAMDGIQRDDFPILREKVHSGKPLVYLDSAASSQKPLFVLEKMDNYYKTSHSNVHRGAHALAMRATEQFEQARVKVKQFVNAPHAEDIVFTKGATEAINLVALSWGQRLRPGDEIVLSISEHHANLVPWQMLAQRTGAVLKFVQLTPDTMELDMDHYQSLLRGGQGRVKLVALAHASNVLGSYNPMQDIIKQAHDAGAIVLVDACQSVPHMPVDVQALGADFLVASSHKMCGPTGIGFLYGKQALLQSMPPIFGGGEMIRVVELQSSTYAAPPSRFEAGTPAIAEAVGLGAACEYLTGIGMGRIQEHDSLLGSYLYDRLAEIDSLDLYGPPTSRHATGGSSTSRGGSGGTRTGTGTGTGTGSSNQVYHGRTGVVAFNSKTIHANDLSFFLDQEGVAVRTGHHCAQPLHRHLGIPGSVRASLYFYNNRQDVDMFIDKLKSAINMFDSLSLD
jgi:cysteine desulfurase / selenocysteine lyase